MVVVGGQAHSPAIEDLLLLCERYWVPTRRCRSSAVFLSWGLPCRCWTMQTLSGELVPGIPAPHDLLVLPWCFPRVSGFDQFFLLSTLMSFSWGRSSTFSVIQAQLIMGIMAGWLSLPAKFRQLNRSRKEVSEIRRRSRWGPHYFNSAFQVRFW